MRSLYIKKSFRHGKKIMKSISNQKAPLFSILFCALCDLSRLIQVSEGQLLPKLEILPASQLIDLQHPIAAPPHQTRNFRYVRGSFRFSLSEPIKTILTNCEPATCNRHTIPKRTDIPFSRDPSTDDWSPITDS